MSRQKLIKNPKRFAPNIVVRHDGDIVLSNIYIEHEYAFSLTRYLILEWSIWSKCLGKVLVINGTSSAGKTTFTKYLESALDFKRISLDDIGCDLICSYLLDHTTTKFSLVKQILTWDEVEKILLQGYKINLERYDQEQRQHIEDFSDALTHSFLRKMFNDISVSNVLDRAYDVAKSFIFSGQDVVIDIVLKNNDLIHKFSYCFRGYPTLIMLLYSPLEQILENCFIRNKLSKEEGKPDYRMPSVIIEQYFEYYKVISDESNSNLGCLNGCKIENALNKIIENVSNTIGLMIDSIGMNKVLEREASSIAGVKSIISDDKLAIISNTKYNVLVKLSNESYTLSLTNKEEEYVQYQFGIDEISLIGVLLNDFYYELLW